MELWGQPSVPGFCKEIESNSEVLMRLGLQSIFPSMDLAQILKNQEGKTLEFKRDLSSPKGVLRSLVAVANHRSMPLVILFARAALNIFGDFIL